jgi:hypothetical protein
MPIFSTRLVDERGARITGRLGNGGQPRGLDGEAFLHHLPGDVQVCALWEDQFDGRQAQHGFGADRLQVRRAAQRVFQRHSHQAFDLLGRQAWSLGLDFDPRGSELREDVQRRLAKAAVANHQEPRGQREHQERLAQRRGYDGV